MSFLPGNLGKPKGAISQRARDFRTVLERNDFIPAEALLEIYHDARFTYKSYVTIFEAIVRAAENKQGFSAPTADNTPVYMRMALDAAIQMCKFSYPSLKAIELTDTNSLDGLTNEQKIEALKGALKFLETGLVNDKPK